MFKTVYFLQLVEKYSSYIFLQTTGITVLNMNIIRYVIYLFYTLIYSGLLIGTGGENNLGADTPQGISHLWGFFKSCQYAELCRGGCNWTAHVFFNKRGNNPYELSIQGYCHVGS